ncbi:carboxypeptidase-like regulatory domain-containing protein [Limibacter armeniacum]|uniref:carboxypeptidase-like regulatory domain-containing protein n=1 Tax=Limibacter armeniacum TaxID=466084 RepID=UPI002FE53D39
MNYCYSLLLCLLLMIANQVIGQQQHFDYKRDTYQDHSDYSYYYKITDEEAQQLYLEKPNTLSTQYFHTLYDSIPANYNWNASNLTVGHYLLVDIRKERMEVTVVSNNPAHCVIHQNDRDLQVSIHNRQGDTIQDAEVSINGKSLQWNSEKALYVLEKSNEKGCIIIEHQGKKSFYPVTRNRDNPWYKRAQQDLVYNTPLRGIPWAMQYANINRHISTIERLIQYGEVPYFLRRIVNLFDPDEIPYKNYQGYLATNKPMYKPGDTVMVKAFMTEQYGTPLHQEVKLVLSERYSYHSSKRILATVSPYKKGAYRYEFVLHDSLELTLDKRYVISFDDKQGRNIVNNHFDYSDYLLDETELTLNSNHDTYFRGMPLDFFVQATGPNGLNLLDGKLSMDVMTHRIDEVYTDRLFIPDTLHIQEVRLDEVGKTKITLPQHLFIDGKMEVIVRMVLVNGNNERRSSQKTITLDGRKERLKLVYEDNKVKAHYLLNNESVKRKALLTTEYRDKSFENKSDSIWLPAEFDYNGIPFKFLLSKDNLRKELIMSRQGNRLAVQTSATPDSIFFSIQNPDSIKVWYELYKKSGLVNSGKGEVSKAIASNKPEHYTLFVHQLWGGESSKEKFHFTNYPNMLHIAMKQPNTVIPGQKTEVTVKVTDYKGNPVPDVDLTAFALTDKFEGKNTPDLPLWENPKYSPRLINKTKHSAMPTLDYPLAYQYYQQSTGLDSLLFYQAIYPTNGLAELSVTDADSITKFVPVISENGRPLTVHYFSMDDSLIYFSKTNTFPQFVFRATPGKHQLKFRTSHHEITVEDVEFRKEVRNIMGIDISQANPRVSIQKKNNKLSKKEKSWLNQHLTKINLSNSTWREFPNQYIWQSNRIEQLKHNRHSPLFIDSFNKSVKGFDASKSFDKYGIHQPIYSDSLLLEEQPVLKGRYKLNDKSKFSSLEDKLLTDKIWDAPPTIEIVSPHILDYYINADTLNHQGDASLMILRANQDYTFLGQIYFFDKNRHQVFAKQHNEQLDVPVGNYDLLLWLTNADYIWLKDVALKANGTNLIQLDKEGIFTVDTYQYLNAPILQQPYIQRIGNSTDGYVKGTVMTSQNLPVIGAIVSNGKEQTLTDLDGSYKLPIRDSLFVQFKEQIRKMAIENADTVHIMIPSIQPKTENITLTEAYKRPSQERRMGIHRQNSFSRIITPLIRTDDFNGYVSGQITDTSGDPLPGVTVMVKGTTHGTISDLDGHYRLDVPSGATLEFRFIGFKSNEIQVGSSTAISYDIEMEEDVQQLQEVVVMGYGEMQYSLTGSVATVSVTSLNGSVGSVAGVRIRGLSSLYGNRSPSNLDLLIPKSPTTPQQGITSPSAIDNLYAQALQQNSLRQNFRDYAWWKPTLETDRNGEATFEVQYPDDITTWETHILAMNGKKQTGQLKDYVKAFKPLQANLYLPRFLLEGDTVQAIGKVLNYMPDAQEVSTQFTVSSQVTDIPEHEVKDTQLDYHTLVVSSLDSISVTYQLKQQNGYEDGEKRDIPVFPVGVMEESGSFHILQGDSTLTIRSIPEADETTVTILANPIELISEELQGIHRYQYLCTEQLSSKVEALIAYRTIMEAQGQEFPYKKELKAYITKLQKRMSDIGSWGWWEEKEASVTMSNFAVKAILKAHLTGIDINEKKMEKGISFLKDQVLKANKRKLRQLLPTITLLAQHGTSLPYDSLVQSIEKMEELTAIDQLRIRRLQQIAGLSYQPVEDLVASKKETMLGGVFWEAPESFSYFTDSDIEMTCLVYELIRNSGQYQELLPKIQQYFFEQRPVNGYSNTYEAMLISETILADLMKKGKQDANFKIIKEDNTITPDHYPYSLTLRPDETLDIIKKGNIPAFITAYEKHWNEAPEKAEKDFSVSSHFESGNEITTSLESGTAVNLKVTVEVPKDAYYTMIEVPIPAGCVYDKYSIKKSLNEVHRSNFKDKVAIFCQTLPAGKHTFTVPLQVRHTGKFTLNPAKVSLMYFPIFYGREALKKVRVEGNFKT